jgi:PIN domain nuclease of toxin-antitoxin system
VRLLLDTHVFLWWLRNDRRLGRGARDAIADPGSEVRVSAASIWEIALKAAVGKLDWRDGPSTTLATCIHDSGFDELPVTAAHAAAVRDLPRRHVDPFDRLLLAQAAVEGLRFVSADEALRLHRADVIDAMS